MILFNYTMNKTCLQDAPTHTSRVVSAVLLVSFGIVGIPSNLLNLYVFTSKSQRNKLRVRTSTTLILANLTAVDLIGSCINIPLSFCLFVIHYGAQTNIILSRMHFLITSPLLLLNCICLTLLSIDRYDAILRPHRYRLSEGRLKTALVVSWIFSFLIGLWAFLKQTNITLWMPESYNRPTPNAFLLLAAIITFIATLFSNVKIRNALKVKKNEVVNFRWSQRVQATRQEAESRIAIAMVLITSTLVLTYLPWTTVRVVYQFKNIRFHANIYVICRVMLLISHVTQPFIYFGVSKEFRRVVRRLVTARADDISITDQSTARKIVTTR